MMINDPGPIVMGRPIIWLVLQFLSLAYRKHPVRIAVHRRSVVYSVGVALEIAFSVRISASLLPDEDIERRKGFS